MDKITIENKDTVIKELLTAEKAVETGVEVLQPGIEKISKATDTPIQAVWAFVALVIAFLGFLYIQSDNSTKYVTNECLTKSISQAITPVNETLNKISQQIEDVRQLKGEIALQLAVITQRQNATESNLKTVSDSFQEHLKQDINYYRGTSTKKNDNKQNE